MHPHTLLVTGASGQLGHRIADILLQTTRQPLILTSRTPQRCASFVARGARVRSADFNDSAGLRAAFAGAQAMLLISTGADQAGPARLRQHANAIEAAGAAGVRHIAYTSLIRADDTPLSAMSADHARTEGLLRDSGLPHTVLRHALYADLLLTTLPVAIASGELFTTRADAGVAYVMREDCAAADAAVLREGGTGPCRHLDITGPESVSAHRLAEAVDRVLGIPLRVRELPLPDYVAALRRAGLPAPVADMLGYLEHGLAQAAMDVVSNDVKTLTGRAALSIEHFLQQHRRRLITGAWT